MGDCCACGTPNTPIRETTLPNGAVCRVRRCEGCDQRLTRAVPRWAARAGEVLPAAVVTTERPAVAVSDRAKLLDAFAALRT
jgi:transcriptional regulator NrdR family protein